MYGHGLMGGGTSRSGMFEVLFLATVQQTNSFDRETIKRLLAFPLDTNIIWKSHDDSIAQRSAIDQARHEKATSSANPATHLGSDRRRAGHDDSEKAS